MTDYDPNARDDGGAGQPQQGQQPGSDYPGSGRSPWAPPEENAGAYGTGYEQGQQSMPGPFTGGTQYQAGQYPGQYPGAQVPGAQPPGGQTQGGQYPGAPQQSGQPYGYPHDAQAYQQQVTPSYPTPPPVHDPSKRPKGNSKLVAGVAVLALVVGGTAGGVGGYVAAETGSSPTTTLQSSSAGQVDSPAPKGSVAWVVDQAMPSVVQVKVATSRGVASGSGFILSPDGYIMTNNHVVASAAKGSGKIVVVLHDGTRTEAKIVGRDPTTDIAVLKISGFDKLNPAELGRSTNLKVGQSVVAIGSPYRLSGTVTSGIVSSLHRPVRAGGGSGELNTVMDAIQTDAAINPGNSGGPLVNMSGQVIGINSAIYSPGSGASGGGSGGNIGIGFAIPIDQARRTAQEIIRTGHATQTYIGASVGNADGGGVVLAKVFPGTPAEKAGLKAGDVVVKIGKRDTNTMETLIAAIKTKAPGTTVTLTLKDGRTVDVTLGGKPIQLN